MLKYTSVTVLTLLGHVTSSVTWSFDPHHVISHRWHQHWHQHPVVSCLRDIKPSTYLRWDLDLQGHVTSSVTWPFDWPWVTSYGCSIGNDTLSPKVFEILRLKCIWVMVLAFLGHVTSSVKWSLFPWYVVSYRCSIDTNPISWALNITSNLVGVFPGIVPTWPLTNISEKWAWSRSRDPVILGL